MKFSHFPSRLTWRPTAFAAMLAATPFVAVAQTAAPDTAIMETVTITARKRPEAAQTVPVSVSAFSADSLERAKITGAQDLQFSIPNAVLTGNDRFTIRGIGNNSLGGDNGVGLAVNGASIGLPPQDELFDLERIEVLRGPQGTLFGRNTTGGALAIFTKKPTDKFGGNISLELGNYNHKRVGGMLNIPINDSVSQRFAGYLLKRDGFTNNEFTGNTVDGRDQYSLRSSTKFEIGDRAVANLVLGVYNENSSRTRESKRQCKSIAVLGCSPTELGFDSPDASATILQTLTRAFTPFPVGGNIYAGAPNPRDLRAIAADFDATFKLKQEYLTFDFSYEFQPFTVSYVAGFSRNNTEQNTDWDNSALPFRFTRPITYNMARDVTVTTDRLLTTDSFVGSGKGWSHELRVVSNNKGMFNYTAGLFQLATDSDGGFFVWHPAIEAFAKARGWGPEAYFVNGETKLATTSAWAAFGEGQWQLSDNLRTTLGARFTNEKKNTLSRNIVLTDTQPFTQKPEIDSSWWTGRASVDYIPRKDMLVYGTLATGFKGGGFNAGNATKPTFSPETVTAYEVGVKSQMLDGTLRANVALFLNDYKNMQLAQRASGSAITANADAKTSGLEAELLYSPSRPWLLDANFSILKTSIGDFLTVDSANPGQSVLTKTPEVAVNLSGNKLPHSPETKIKVGVQYTSPFFNTGWQSIARLDYVWQGDYFAREFNTAADAIGAWGIANLQWRFINPKKDLEVKAFVKNLSNANNITNIIIEDALVGNYRNVRLLDPRTFGVQVEYKF
jgi:iron complex outermembrane recepter protein